MKHIAIVGSTGSIGTQALEIVRAQGHRVAALAAGSNARLLVEQALEFRPDFVAIFDESRVHFIQSQLAGTGIQVFGGAPGIRRAAGESQSEIVLNAAVGIAGLEPTLAAIQAGKTLALANKESLVCAGELVLGLCAQNRVTIIPVDSEHSAIYQCLRCGRPGEVERVILTASGGPFFRRTAEELAVVTPEQALRHPNWSMGSKITIDSATMMNKGFEVIEAMHLFKLDPHQIEVVVHRESIIHSMVEYQDGAVIAQLSPPDMGLAIQYALDDPRRSYSPRPRLDLTALGSLHFAPPDDHGARALALCRTVMEEGGNRGVVLNGANERAVQLFLDGRLAFDKIVTAVAYALDAVAFEGKPDFKQLYADDCRARRAVDEYMGYISGFGHKI